MRNPALRFMPGLVLLLIAAQPMRPVLADDQPDAPSAVAVTTQTPRRGTMQHVIEGWGTAVASASAMMTLSQPQDGVVAEILATPGERLRKGDPVMRWGPSAAANAQLDQARNALNLANDQRNNTARLLSQNLATRDQLTSAEKTVLDARAALAALHRDGGDSPTFLIRMPSDGIVVTLPVAAGDRTQPGAPLATLQRAGGLVVTAGVEQADAALVRPGQPVQLQPLAGGSAIAGTITRVDAVLNPRTRLIDVDIAPPAGGLISGADYGAKIAVGTFDGWLVPHEAVLTDDQGAYLFQLAAGKPPQAAKRVPAQVLGTQGDTDIVTAAIDPALALVVTGGHQLTDGAPTRIAEPAR